MDQELQEKLESINEELRSINASSSLSKKSVAKSFVLGALGATLGFAILVAIIGYILKIFGVLPGVGNWFISLGRYLHKQN